MQAHKRLFLFILFGLIVVKSTFAQLSIDSAALAQNGKNFVIGYTFLSPKYRVQLSELTHGNTIDFSKLKPDTRDTIRFLSAQNSRYAEFFPQCNRAMHSATQMSRFYIHTKNELLEVGQMGDFFGIGAPIYLVYDTTYLAQKLPLKAGNSITDTITRLMRFPYFESPNIDSVRADVFIRTESEMVTTQKVITPYGSYECLFEKQTRFEDIRAYKHHPTFSWAPFRELDRKGVFYIYRWHHPKTGYPIAEALIDRGGFVKHISYQIYEPLRLKLVPYHNRCHGDKHGAIDLQISGGVPDFSILWSNGYTKEDMFNLAAGTYSVTVTDNNGLQVTDYVVIEEPEKPFFIETIATNVSCKGAKDAKIEVNIRGGTPNYLYEWTDGILTLNRDSLRPGTYVVYVQDKQKCLRNDTVIITEPAEKLDILFTETPIKCHNGSDGAIEAFVTGGTKPYQYQWNNGANSAKAVGLSADTYKLTVTDKNNCQLTDSFRLRQPTSPIQLKARITDLSCFEQNDGSISLTIKGGKYPYDVYWDNQQTNTEITNLKAQTYRVQITDKNFCTKTDSFVVKQPEKLQLLVEKKHVTCFGYQNGEIALKISGGTPEYKAHWSDNNDDLVRKNLKGGIYQLTVEDKNSCKIEQQIEIKSPTMPLDVQYKLKHIFCKGDSTGQLAFDVIGGQPPYLFYLNNKPATSSNTNLPANIYATKLIDKLGCVHTDTINLLEPANGIEVQTAIEHISCYGQADGSIALTISGGSAPYSVVWNDSSTSLNKKNLPKGHYKYLITDNKGCKKTENITINEPRKIQISFEKQNTTIVGNDGNIQTTVYGGTPPYKAHWNDGDSLFYRSNLDAGGYTLNLTDKNNCQATASLTLTVESVGFEQLQLNHFGYSTFDFNYNDSDWLIVKKHTGQQVYNGKAEHFVYKYHLKKENMYVFYILNNERVLKSTHRYFVK